MLIGKKLIAAVLTVGMLISNTAYLQISSIQVNAAEAVTEEEIHIWDGTSDTSWYDDEETEFHISTPEQLAGMAAIVNTGKTMEGKTFFLDNDIYLNDVSTYDEWETTPPENEWISFEKFSGTFQGDNHSIIGMYSTSGGMFENVTNGCISEFNLIDLYIFNVTTSDAINGGIIDVSENSSFFNCSVQGNIKCSLELSSTYYPIRIGGIVSYSNHDRIINCTNSVNINISGVGYTLLAGGICGYCDESYIANCINKGKVTATYHVVSWYGHIGGICGASNGKITNCKNCGDLLGVSIYNNSESYVSGICGVLNAGEVTDCYNIGRIEGDKCSGIGMFSDENSSIIDNVYNIGMIVDSEKFSYSSSYGIASFYRAASFSSVCLIDNAYYLSGTALKGIEDNDIAIAKTETNMKKESFADSLGEAFYYVEGEYPKLAFEVGRTISEFDKTSFSFKEYGETQTLTLETTYLGTPEWISSDTSVATVDENGVVTAVGNGIAMIYALCSDSKAACSVSVGYDYYLSDNELSMKKGRVHDLTVYSASDNTEVTDIELEWRSSDDSVVSVDSEGKLTANGKGTAVVTVQLADMELSCIVCVYEYVVPVIPVEDDENAPKLSETDFSISTIETKQLSVLNYTDTITWVSSNTAIAKVNDNGIVRAVSEGKTSVYALLSDGRCLKADVTVIKSEYAMGDVNLDGEFNVTDAVVLQKWLLAIPDTELLRWENADFYKDGKLNVFDLCLMKRNLISR